jgi:hypothetical protein
MALKTRLRLDTHEEHTRVPERMAALSGHEWT